MNVVIQLIRHELLRACASEVVIQAVKVKVFPQPSNFAITNSRKGWRVDSIIRRFSNPGMFFSLLLAR